MASFSYARSFSHTPWRNHEDVVDAEGDNGFNRRFQDLEAEFDTIGTTIGAIGTEVDKLHAGLSVPSRQQPVAVITRNLGPNEVSDPEPLDTYDNAGFPDSRPKLYTVRLVRLAAAPHGQVSHHFIYTPGAAQTQVQIWFKNEKNQATGIVAQVFALS